MTDHQPTQRELSMAEYFAGIGLVRMGLEPYGWRIVFANDISPQKFEMYQAFFPEANDHYLVQDIFSLNSDQIPSTTLATCSFPCIDLSLAGNMNGVVNGKHSSAFWGFIKMLSAQGETAPPLVMVENVTGWMSSNKGADFRVTVHALNQLGYYCDVFVLDALRFSPQSRKRVFLIGTRHPQHFGFEGILARPTSLTNDRLRENITANQDLNWSWFDIPNPPHLHTNGLSAILEDISDNDDRWWPEKEVTRHLKMMEETHRERVNHLMRQTNYSYRTFFRRRREGEQRVEVRNDDISGCLRTAVGGSSKQFLIKAGMGQIKMRIMTPREYARLQGVPDHFAITVEETQALTGFGDAVCVPAISWIAENVLAQAVRNLSRVQAGLGTD